MNQFLNLLKQRRSTRVFTDKKITPAEIDKILQAALMSPSGKSINEWAFIVIDDSTLLEKLAQSKAHGSQLLEKAPLAIVVIGDTTKSDVWIEDCSIASIIIQLQAEAMGLGSCWVQIRQRSDKNGTPSENVVRDLLAIPQQYGIESIIAIGEKAQERKPFDESKLQKEKIHYNQYR